MTLALAANSVNVPYGSTSSALALQITSKSGLAGTVTLSCAGLSVGVTCSFNPAAPTIAAGGQATSLLTVSATLARSAGMSLPKGTGAILLAPVYLFLLWRIRKDARKLRMLVCLLFLSVASMGILTGCSGSGTNATRPASGSQTILVVATSGSTTKSVPLTVNLQ